MNDERLQTAIALLRAMRDNNRDAVARYRRECAITETNPEVLAATLRFWQIGMANSYEEALLFFQKENQVNKEIENLQLETLSNTNTVKYWKNILQQDMAKEEEKALGYYKRSIEDLKAQCEELRKEIEKVKKS
jgi:hypothetical protein